MSKDPSTDRPLALITGATAGIGEACARALAQQGYPLHLLGRRLDRLQALQRELAGQAPAVTIAQVDVSDRAQVQDWATQHDALLSRSGILINNAGLAKGLDLIQDGQLDDWEAMIDTNLKGLLYVTRAVLPHWLKRKHGHLVNLGSVAGHWTYPRGNVYSATKYAVRSLTESLRLDLLGTGIRVTEIAPGMVETEFSQVRLGSAERAKAVYAGMTPLRAVDIAEAVIWALDRPAHVTIQEIVLYPTDQASPTQVHRKGS